MKSKLFRNLLIILTMVFLTNCSLSMDPAESVFDLSQEKNISDGDIKAMSETVPFVNRLNISNSHITNMGLAFCSKFTNLTILSVSNTQIDNSGLIHIRNLKHLKGLDVSRTQVSNRALVHIVKLESLKKLNLSDTPVNDKVIKYLAERKNDLEILLVANTNITDKSIEYFKAFKKLEALQVTGTKISKDGYRALKNVLPDCDIYFYQMDGIGDKSFYEDQLF